MNKIIKRYERIWVISNLSALHDPEGRIFKWLNSNARFIKGVEIENHSPEGEITVGIFTHN